MGALFQSRGWLPIVEAPGYFRHPTSILVMQLLNAVKCNLKELTTKSTWVPRSAVFSTHMPGGWLHRSCDSLACSVFPSCWVLSAIFFPSHPSPRRVGFFSTDAFVSVTVACSFPLVGGGGGVPKKMCLRFLECAFVSFLQANIFGDEK